jgi:protein O-mannosyl-transferase
MERFLKIKYTLPIILIVVGFFVYSFNLDNQLYWDDDDWILNNQFVHSISLDNIKFWLTNNTLAGVGLQSNYYRPFLFFTFAFNYVVSEIKPWSYHLLSNSIHLANGVIIYWLLNQIFKRKLYAFLVALIFIIHPLQTEAITYISGRGDSLVVMFMLFALALFYKSEVENLSWLSWKRILSLILLVLGILSRETGIIFPFLAVILYMSFLTRARFWEALKESLFKTWPYFAVVLIYGVLRLTVLNFLNTLNFYTVPNVYSENFHVRMFTFANTLLTYFKLLVVPTGLHMERSTPIYLSLFKWPVLVTFLGVGILLWWLRFLYKRQSRDLSFKIWFFGSSLFFIALGPVSGITPINAFIYEHWLYLPMIGFWMIAVYYIIKLFDYIKSKSLNTFFIILTTGLVAYLSFFGYQAIERNILWGKPIEFYKDILKYEPDSVRINNNIGNLYFNEGNIENAELYYREATKVNDIFAQPYYNLGSILQKRDDVFGAIQLYEKAIEIDPNFYYPYQNLAVIYAQQGDLTRSIESLDKLKSLIPMNPRVYYNSALVYITLNDRETAIENLKIGLTYAKFDQETGQLIQELINELQK